MLLPWVGNKFSPTPFFFIAIIPPPLKYTLQRGIFVRITNSFARISQRNRSANTLYKNA